ncbi:MAG: nucleotidyl transferase AbiEii/AbiGii toxin family protein [Bacteroidetes bacterium]|nr:nucleotidyl transferase AbiEii/AbiGii toxin family protein [Bacteroidota bacterium]
MHSVVEDMLKKYDYSDPDRYKNALKEVIQEIALLGLFRGGLFDEAAFYGGTALRILYGIDRFSQDLDFSLLEPDKKFGIDPYCEFIENELSAYGFKVRVSPKKKSARTNVESAFIKGGTMINMMQVETVRPPVSGVHGDELLTVKLEVDVDPPAGATYELKHQLMPIPYTVRLFSQPSLFAGKLHAILCRRWGSGRMKGRDLYDYLWYLAHSIPVDLKHLQARMVQTGHWKKGSPLTEKDLRELLDKRFGVIDYGQAKQDVFPYITDHSALDLWSAEFFKSITADKLKCG